MKLRIHISASATIIAAALIISPILLGAKPALKLFIEPVKTIPVETEDLSSLIKELGSKDGNIRSHAIEALSKRGETAVPSIIEALTDTNSNVRKGAAEALGNIGNIRPEVVPSLIKLLIDRDSYVRKSTAESLDKIGEPSIPSILKALTDTNGYVRKGAAEALGNTKTLTPEIIPSLINALKDRDGNVRNAVAEALEKRGAMTAELKARRYILDLGDTNVSSESRMSAIDALDKIGPIIPEVIPSFISALIDSDYLVRKGSAECLDKRGVLTESLKAERYIADLKYGKSVVRIKAVEALGKIGAVTPEVVPSIINSLGDKEVCDTAIKALGNIGPEAKKAVPSLAKLLADSNITVRAEAAKALGNIGPESKSATSQLMVALKDGDSAVSAEAAEALKKLGVMTARDNVSYLTFSHPIIALLSGIFLCLALIAGGWFAVPIIWRICLPVSWYIRELHNPQDERRVLAAKALAKFGNQSIPFLIKMMENSNSDIRISAAEALNEFRTLPSETIPLILKFMKDKEEKVRMNIIEIIGKAAPTTEIVFALIKALEEGSSGVRACAAKVLGRNGTNREAIPALKKAIEDSNFQVRENAFEALEKCSSMTIEIKVKRYMADLGDRDSKISNRGMEGLNNIGAEAVPELLKALGDKNIHIRRFASSFLEKHDALPVDLKVKRYILDLGDSNTSVLTKAAEALGNIGPAASEAIPHLIRLIGNKDYYVRRQAAKTLKILGALSQELRDKRYNLDLADSNRDGQNKTADDQGIIGQEEKEALSI